MWWEQSLSTAPCEHLALFLSSSWMALPQPSVVSSHSCTDEHFAGHSGLLQVSGVLSVQLFPFWSSFLQILSALVFPDSPLHFHTSACLHLISSSLCCDLEVFSGSKLGQLIVYFAFSSGRVNPLLCLSFIIVLNNLQNFQIPFHFFCIFLFLLFFPPFWSFILIGTLLEYRLPGLQTWFHLPLARKA